MKSMKKKLMAAAVAVAAMSAWRGGDDRVAGRAGRDAVRRIRCHE